MKKFIRHVGNICYMVGYVSYTVKRLWNRPPI